MLKVIFIASLSVFALAEDHACDCMASWTYQGETYEGCSPTADTSRSWCYTQAECAGAETSTEDGAPSTTWVYCGDGCQCMAEWLYPTDGQTYEGCSPTSDYDRSWCYTDGACQNAETTVIDNAPSTTWLHCEGGCKCMEEWTYPTDGQTYMGCSATSDYARSWCYTDGACLNADVTAIENAPSEWWLHCGAGCECMDSWIYPNDEQTYEGCAPTSDYSRSWCYTDGSCLGSDTASVDLENLPSKSWLHCGMGCECMDSWMYPNDEMTYEGCSPTSDYDRSWCYTKGSCMYAEIPTITGTPGPSWLHCEGGCKCMDSWMYPNDEMTYEGCSPTSDYDRSWCYTDGACLNADMTAIDNAPSEWWLHCGSGCECQASWTYPVDEQTYEGCSPTSDYDRSWCYPDGSCLGSDTANTTLENLPSKSWLHCSDGCQCMESWMYPNDEMTYEGCSPTSDYDRSWCYSDGSCMYGEIPTITGTPGPSWLHCDGGCRCMDEWMYPTDGMTYTGCSPTSDYERSWCYSDGACLNAESTAIDDAPSEWWLHCNGGCQCMESWMYPTDGQTYQGCSPTSDTGERAWCYTDSACAGAEPAAIKDTPSPSWFWCGDCECMPSWTYPTDSMTYHQCSATSDTERPWCYTMGTCDSAEQATIEDPPSETWNYCVHKECECQSTWMRAEISGDNTVYEGCSATVDDPRPWCFTVGECPGANPSTTKEGEHWIYCQHDACECMDSWNYQGSTYSGCSPTSDGDRAWCYTMGECPGVEMSTEDAAPSTTWQYCEDITCADFKEFYRESECCGMPEKTMQKPEWCFHHGMASCDSLKEQFRSNGCCGMPEKVISTPSFCNAYE